MRRAPRQPSKLSEPVHRQLNLYALAAGAAGVSLLALAPPAEAKVVYTPAHKFLLPNQPFYLDLNHDHISDFRLLLSSLSSTYVKWFGLGPSGSTSGNSVLWLSSNGHHCAKALSAGRRVGSKGQFQQNNLFMFRTIFGYGTWSSYCPWTKVTKAYLGMKFVVKGRVHFGWARFGNIQGRRSRPELTGYAYETIPNKAIVTGKTKGPDVITMPPDSTPGSLGRLAMGRK